MKTKVLVCDDVNEVRTELAKILVENGCEVTCVENGLQGLQAADQECFDLVIADVHMPVMDGPEMIHNLRTRNNYQQTPILGLTGDKKSALVKDMQQCKKSEIRAWIIKPVQESTVGPMLQFLFPAA